MGSVVLVKDINFFIALVFCSLLMYLKFNCGIQKFNNTEIAINFYNEIHTLHLQIYSESLFLAILLMKQKFKLVWPYGPGGRHIIVNMYHVIAMKLQLFCITIYIISIKNSISTVIVAE